MNNNGSDTVEPQGDKAGASLNREELIGEVNYLRSLVAELSDQREDDRRSILILQGQIDNLRDAKCSDSFENSMRNISAVCQSLWSRVPSVQLEGFIHYLSRRSKKKSGKKSSKSSVASSTRRSGVSHRRKSEDTQGSIFQLNKFIPRGS
jgi:hypothetical protein